MGKRITILSLGVLVSVGATSAFAADLIGDFFDMSIGRLPQLPRTEPLEVIFGPEEAFVGLTPAFQMILTRDPMDPLMAIPLVTIRTGLGERREYAIELDFNAMLTNLPAVGFPVELFIPGTKFWFDDLELVDANGNGQAGFIDNVLLVGSPGADGEIEIGNPLSFGDGNGVDPPELSDTDESGFGELLVLSITNGAPLFNYPILRIEFDLIAEIIGDFDGDGDVDLADYVRLQTLFTGASSSPGGGKLNEADFDADGDVDLADVLTFLEYFTGPGVQLAVAQGP